ncbi:hypothetical protein OH687_22590 [Burkholderia anthina]|nr:hypothetical protein OH687_22590 [Burkholderia anthina]
MNLVRVAVTLFRAVVGTPRLTAQALEARL